MDVGFMPSSVMLACVTGCGWALACSFQLTLKPLLVHAARAMQGPHRSAPPLFARAYSPDTHLAEIRPPDRFPFCIVWSPIPVLTWIWPFIGHMGIALSSGVILDFAGEACSLLLKVNLCAYSEHSLPASLS